MRLSALLLPLAVSASVAHAQSSDSPWYLGGSLGWTQLSNVYRVPAGTTGLPADVANDDQVVSASLLAGARARLGRQTWKLDTRVSRNDYRRNRGLRNVGYSGTLSWDWASGSRLSGQVLFGSQRNLAPFNPGNAPTFTEKNVERNDRARASIRYGLYSLWALEGSVTWTQRDFSLPLYDRFDNDQRSAAIGLNWQPSPALSTRLAVRQSKGKFPRFRERVPAGSGYDVDRFTGDAIDLSGNWTLSPTNQLSLRLSDNRNRYTEAAARNYRGRSGQFTWTWSPTSRLSFQTQLARETGDDARQFSSIFGTIDSLNSRRYDTLQLQAVYALTSKVSFDASASEARREFVDTFGLSSGSSKDRARSSSLGVRWAFDRNGQLSCQTSRDSRQGAVGGLSQPYSARSYGCSVQYLLNG